MPDHLHQRHVGRAQGGAARPALPDRPGAAGRALAGARPGDLVWCTAASGWSKSARNVFIAPWLRGAAALLHDARFDPHERLELLERERVNVLCMAPTEYRVIAKRAALRPLPDAARAGRGRRGAEPRGAARLARGDRPRDPRRLRPDRDRPAHRDAGRRAGAARLDGPAAARRRPARDRRRAGVADPATDPTFFLGYLGESAPAGPWRTGDRVRRRGRLPVLRGPHRRRDHLGRLPHRPVRGRVRAGLAPGGGRGRGGGGARRGARRAWCARSWCCATGSRPGDALARELQDHVKAQTAPYKYPRIVDFAAELPKTASGKVRRALLREQP